MQLLHITQQLNCLVGQDSCLLSTGGDSSDELVRYTYNMTKDESSYRAHYLKLLDRYRTEVIDANEREARLLYLYRGEMVTNAQLHKELEIARETLDTLLFPKTVDKPKTATHS